LIGFLFPLYGFEIDVFGGYDSIGEPTGEFGGEVFAIELYFGGFVREEEVM
jgi:hypothetical protein